MLRALSTIDLKRGRSVASDAATIPRPGSMQLQTPILIALLKKTGPFLRPGMYAIRMRELILPTAPRLSKRPDEILADRGILLFQRTKTGRHAKVQSLAALREA